MLKQLNTKLKGKGIVEEFGADVACDIVFLGEDRSKEFEDRLKWKSCALCKVKMPADVSSETHVSGKRHRRLLSREKRAGINYIQRGSVISADTEISVSVINSGNNRNKKKRGISTQEAFFSSVKSFHDIISCAKWLNHFNPPSYNKDVALKKTSRRFSLFPLAHIPGAFRGPLLPNGLWQYDGTVYNEIDTAGHQESNKGFKAGGDGGDGDIDAKDVIIDAKPIVQTIFCKISKAQYKSSIVAVKEFVSNIPMRDRKKIKAEAKNMLGLDHPNVIKFFGIIPERCAIVMAYTEKVLVVDGEQVLVNDVRGLLDNVEDDYDWVVRRTIAMDSARAVEYLHSKGIIHADIKAANFFLGGGNSSNFIVKLGDFGESVRFSKMTTLATSSLQLSGNKKQDQRRLVGTLPFIAPELIEMGAKPSKESDIYSFGMYLLELLVPSRSHPWSEDCHSPDLVTTFLRDGKRPSLPIASEGSPPEMQSFISAIKSSWKSDPNERANLSILMKNFHYSNNSKNIPPSKEVRKDNNAAEFDFQQWSQDDDGVEVKMIHLHSHQGGVLDMAGEVASSIISAEKGHLPDDINMELQKTVNSLDGTNACQFYSASFAASFLDKDEIDFISPSGLKETIDAMIFDIPKKVNAYRDVTQEVFLEEALDILNNTGVVSTTFELLELFSLQADIISEEGLHELEKAITKLVAASTIRAVAVYTCSPISFSICSLKMEEKSLIVIIDSHKIPHCVGGNDSGMIMLVAYTKDEVDIAVAKISRWVKARMLSSSRKGGRQSLLMMSPQATTTSQKIFMDDLEMMDVTDEQLLNYFNQSGEVLEEEAETSNIADEEMLSSVPQLDVDEKDLEAKNECFFLPTDIPVVNEEDELLWKGHLTKFGYSSFKSFQVTAINAIEKGLDVVVVQPTGTGKSLCFQIPSLIHKNKMTVVISPTLSLIQSQIADLKGKGISAIPLGRCAGEDAEANKKLVFDDGDVDKPDLVYTTPEHFNNVMPLFKKNIKYIKMIVLDEVHKVFDRQSNFRESYNSLPLLKVRLPGIPIMALTATLSEENLQTLCRDYLYIPVLIRGSVDRQNIKLSVLNYKTDSKKKKISEGAGTIWKPVCDDLGRLIGEHYAIVYMDFTNEVKELASSLQSQIGLDVTCFYGKGLSVDKKTKIVDDFNNEKFQVLCATESYEVGVHNPHVDIVARIGCMRNMNVFLQEIGRAGRSTESSGLGVLFINEHKDDQRLGYWLKGCNQDDEIRIKKDYEACWKWIYSIYTGECLRKGILQHYNETYNSSDIDPKDCCLCCELETKEDFDIKNPLFLLLKAILELERALNKNKEGISERKIVSWLRGAKQDWLAEPSIQEAIDASETYCSGKEVNGKQWTNGAWENLIRQSVKLGYVEIKFQTFDLKVNAKSIVRTYRSYTVPAKGDEFMRNPQTVMVMSPFICLLKSKYVQETKNRKRSGRNCHYLPKIKDMLSKRQTWVALKNKEEYEYPGYLQKDMLYYCENYATKAFAAKSRVHYMYDDNQLSKSSSQTQQHEVNVDGIKTKIYIKRSLCEGVKVCSGCESSSYTVSKRQRINRCATHKNSIPLKETGPCPVQFLYIWPVEDDGRRWVGTINGHIHNKPAPHKISSHVQEDIQTSALNNLRSTAKDLSKGLGMGYAPYEKSIAAANIDRVRRERRLVIGSILSQGKRCNTNAIATIIDFEKIRLKVERSQDDENQPLTEKINILMGGYQMEGNGYIFTATYKFAFFMAPFQAEQLAQASYIFVDVTYTGNESFPYLLNVVSLNEKTLLYNAVSRVLCNKQDGPAYGKAFTEIFSKVTEKHPDFKNGDHLDVILVDFDDAQANGLKEALGHEKAEKVLRGCKVHWTRSLQRVAKLVTKSKEEQRIFLHLGNQIPNAAEKEQVKKLFQFLSGEINLSEASDFLRDEMQDLVHAIDTQSWKRLKCWSQWWCRPNHLQMFTRAHTWLDEGDWEKAPKTTNPVESINRQSIHEKGCTLFALLENIYTEDRGHAAKIVAMENNVTLSYAGNEESRRKKRNDNKKRKRSSLTNASTDDIVPPDKRRHIEKGSKPSPMAKRRGKSLVGTKVSVEYQEMHEGNMKYMGWFNGQIVAFNRRDGYFVEFQQRESEGTIIKGWSEWLEDIDSPDIKLL